MTHLSHSMRMTGQFGEQRRQAIFRKCLIFICLTISCLPVILCSTLIVRLILLAYGHPKLHTPNIDALAERGTLFEQTYVQSPVCGPSGMSYYTGRYMHSHGVSWNFVPLTVGEMTLGDHLRPPVSNSKRLPARPGFGWRVKGAGSTSSPRVIAPCFSICKRTLMSCTIWAREPRQRVTVADDLIETTEIQARISEAGVLIGYTDKADLKARRARFKPRFASHNPLVKEALDRPTSLSICMLARSV